MQRCPNLPLHLYLNYPMAHGKLVVNYAQTRNFLIGEMMTIKQCQIRGCRYLQTSCLTCGRLVCEKTLPPRQSWIKLTACKPKKLEECWIAHYLPSGDKEAGHCYSFATFLGDRFIAFNSDKTIPNVTHWMPLPDGPED